LSPVSRSSELTSHSDSVHGFGTNEFVLSTQNGSAMASRLIKSGLVRMLAGVLQRCCKLSRSGFLIYDIRKSHECFWMVDLRVNRIATTLSQSLVPVPEMPSLESAVARERNLAIDACPHNVFYLLLVLGFSNLSTPLCHHPTHPIHTRPNLLQSHINPPHSPIGSTNVSLPTSSCSC